jgi:CHAD domain-containing protein
MMIPIETDSDLSVDQAVFRTSESIQQDIFGAADLSKENTIESVHMVRKRLKLYRAFLKLFRNCGNPEKLDRANLFLRDHGRMFSALRDAHVRIWSFENIFTDQSFDAYPDSVKTIAGYNHSETDKLEATLLVDEHIFGCLKNDLLSDSSIEDYLESADLSFECIAGGLADTFELCCNAWYSVSLNPTAEQMHEWRKRVKDLQYQYELTENLRPADIVPIYDDILALTELLGLDQDLNNLMTWILQLPQGILNTKTRNVFIRLLQGRRSRLKAGINHLGKTLFTIDPALFRQSVKPIYSYGTG